MKFNKKDFKFFLAATLPVVIILNLSNFLYSKSNQRRNLELSKYQESLFKIISELEKEKINEYQKKLSRKNEIDKKILKTKQELAKLNNQKILIPKITTGEINSQPVVRNVRRTIAS